jgi:hypothetical protein
MGLGSGIWDPGSGKNLFRISDPGVKKAPDPGSGSATLVAGCPGARQRVPNQRHGHRYGDTQVPGSVLPLFVPLLASYWLDIFTLAPIGLLL